ncbi:MAG TPA: hypothetical protein VJR89_37750 [Polyangiales bacterium]|nr:hypothetical protein [Polyangiales bacterium]
MFFVDHRKVGSRVASWAGLLLALSAGCASQDSSPAARRAPHEPIVREPAPAADPVTPLDVEDPTPEAEAPAADVATRADRAGDTPAASETAAERDRSNEAEPAIRTDDGAPAQPAVRSELAPLPAPSEGACAFEPRPAPGVIVDNPNCPDGVWQGGLSLYSAQTVEKARGCTRVTGDLIIATSNLETLRGLEALRVVEGRMYFDAVDCTLPGGCRLGTQRLTSLDGLDGLRCIAGGLSIGYTHTPSDITALRQLVEVGGDLEVRKDDVPPGAFASLRRVWGNLSVSRPFRADRLEAVYGSAWESDDEGAKPAFYVGCGAGAEYCRDGVLGCEATATTPAELAQYAKCEIAVHRFNLLGAALEHPEAFPPLRSVRGGLNLAASADVTPAVETIRGLDTLRAVAWLGISNLPQLRDFDGLAHVEIGAVDPTRPSELVPNTQERGSVFLRSLPQLEDLASLGGIETLSQLYVIDCPGLQSLSGLEALQQIAGILRLENNANLRSLDGVPNLQLLSRLEIVRDPVLQDVSGLAGLERTTIRMVDVPMLQDLQSLSGVDVTISPYD